MSVLSSIVIPYGFLSIGFVVLGLLLVASASISVECYNKNDQMKTDSKGNFNFSATMVAFGFVVAMVGGLATYTKYKTP
jgi:hypothetical protein